MRMAARKFARGLFVAGCDAAEVLELVEEALDEVAVAVELRIDRALDFAGSGRRSKERYDGWDRYVV